MQPSSLRHGRAAVAAIVLATLASACSGGGATAPTAGILPKSAALRPAAASAGIRSGMERLTKSDSSSQSTARRAMDFTHPSNTTTADPPVPRPNEAPCVVQLFSGLQFTSFAIPTFSYAPPAACPPPWNKVVFEGDFSVTAGRQFDRTGSIWIAGTNIYFGTTAEPSADLGPSWHVERNVTDLGAILKAPSTGEVVLGNIVNSTYTGIISASAKLQFYPATRRYPAADAPDAVYPLSGGPLGDNQYLTTQQQPLTGTFALPKNVRAAYLDVYLQSQIGDEFWYTCFPNDLAALIPNCGNTAFREGDVAVDGQPAGIAPVYPWIYTGGIDPYLWRPIPGVETLEFKPYRVNLTPFAGVFSNGSPHTVTVNVFNNGNYFAANGALLLYLDHGASHVTGGILSDATTLYPSPSAYENVKFNSQGIGSGPVDVTSKHAVSIDGYVNTSQGREETRIRQEVAFSNDQQITANAAETVFDQNIKQATNISSTVTTFGPHTFRLSNQQKYWPLWLDYRFTANPDGSALQYTSVSQAKIERTLRIDRGRPFMEYLSNSVNSTDTIHFNADGTYQPTSGKSSQTYREITNDGYCYDKTVQSANYVITGEHTGPCI